MGPGGDLKDDTMKRANMAQKDTAKKYRSRNNIRHFHSHYDDDDDVYDDSNRSIKKN